MTQTLEPDAETKSPVRQRVEKWLADFSDALAARDADRAAALFAPTSFWRDLIAFTWNITTVEHREGVAVLLRHTMESTDATELPDRGGGGARGGRRHRHGLDPVRDRARAGLGAAAPGRRGRVDPADHAGRAEGVRGAPGRHPAQGRLARRDARTASRGRRPAPPRSRASASPTSRPSQGRTCSRASSSTAPSTPGRTTTRTSGSWSSARTTRRSTSAGRCGRSAPT